MIPKMRVKVHQKEEAKQKGMHFSKINLSLFNTRLISSIGRSKKASEEDWDMSSLVHLFKERFLAQD
jgi:hypothetical protein